MFFVDDGDIPFSIKIHHGGEFIHEPIRKYIGGKITYLDRVTSDRFCMLEFNEYVAQLGIEDCCLYWYQVPGKEVCDEDGLELMDTEDALMEMMSHIREGITFFDVYIEEMSFNEYLGSQYVGSTPKKSNVVIEELDEVAEDTLKEVIVYCGGSSSNTGFYASSSKNQNVGGSTSKKTNIVASSDESDLDYEGQDEMSDDSEYTREEDMSDDSEYTGEEDMSDDMDDDDYINNVEREHEWGGLEDNVPRDDPLDVGDFSHLNHLLSDHGGQPTRIVVITTTHQMKTSLRR